MSTTPYAILGLLSIEPMSGYDIRQHLRESLSSFWSESYGQIYPALKRLETDRLIAPVKQATRAARRRRTYTITRLGLAELRAWLAEPPMPQPPRSELMLKLFFGRLAAPGVTTGHLRRLRIQQERFAATLKEIERQLRVERRGHPDLPYWLLVLGAGVERTEGLIRWSDDALAVLKSMES
jgi:DNA-binding PadR family transcriptional regulator